MIFGKDVMLKIQRSANDTVVFTLSGRIEAEGVIELQRLFDLESAQQQVALDLKDVTLADRDAVKFLLRCEEHGIQLENSPPYIREWIEREKEAKHAGKGLKDRKRSVRRHSD
jgi:ABC-type transporter Mla MlaB component